MRRGRRRHALQPMPSLQDTNSSVGDQRLGLEPLRLAACHGHLWPPQGAHVLDPPPPASPDRDLLIPFSFFFPCSLPPPPPFSAYVFAWPQPAFELINN